MTESTYVSSSGAKKHTATSFSQGGFGNTSGKHETIIQIGARKGKYPYRDIARKYNAFYVLVVPQTMYKEFSGDPKLRGAKVFAVDNPANKQEVIDVLKQNSCLEGVKRNIYFFGERDMYAPNAFALSSEYGSGKAFTPPDKRELYDILEEAGIPQLKMLDVDLSDRVSLERAGAEVKFPAVLKPYNASASLGVVPVNTQEELFAAADMSKNLKDESGNTLKWGLQKKARGEEYSIQGYVDAKGNVQPVSACQKFVRGVDGKGYTEAGHLGYPPEKLENGKLVEKATAIMKALKYPVGPWTMDLLKEQGELYPIDLGTRLPGLSVQDVITDVSGLNLAEMTYCLQSGKAQPRPALQKRDRICGYMTLRESEIPAWKEAKVRFPTILKTRLEVFEKQAQAGPAEGNVAQEMYRVRAGDARGFFEATNSSDLLALFNSITASRGGDVKPIAPIVLEPRSPKSPRSPKRTIQEGIESAPDTIGAEKRSKFGADTEPRAETVPFPLFPSGSGLSR